MREVSPSELVTSGEELALVDAAFGDPMTGRALVYTRGERYSSQGVVTTCTFYEQYTTEEKLQAAAASYGGLTEG